MEISMPGLAWIRMKRPRPNGLTKVVEVIAEISAESLGWKRVHAPA